MTLYEIPVKKANGEEVTLREHKGKVLIIVNTATQCGLS